MADIGSDHALLPLWLLENGKTDSAIAGELGDGPFLRAKEAGLVHGQKKNFSVRQGDGLQVLLPAEVETVVIAGMGGDLIAEILGYSLEKSRSFARYILQPMKHEAVLRKWLTEQGWRIRKERLILENEKYYAAMEVFPGKNAEKLSDLEVLLGPCLLQSKEENVQVWLRRMQQKYERIAQSVANSHTASEEEKGRWRMRAAALRDILEQKRTEKAGV